MKKIKVGDTVKIIDTTNEYYGLIGTVYQVCDRKYFPYNVKFVGEENWLKTGFSKRIAKKFADEGFIASFDENELNIIINV